MLKKEDKVGQFEKVGRLTPCVHDKVRAYDLMTREYDASVIKSTTYREWSI